MKILIITLTILVAIPAFAGFYQNVTITGKIVKFDKNTVTLSQKGHHTVVPRKLIPQYFKIKLGNEVSAIVRRDRVLASVEKANDKKANLKKDKIKARQ